MNKYYVILDTYGKLYSTLQEHYPNELCTYIARLENLGFQCIEVTYERYKTTVQYLDTLTIDDTLDENNRRNILESPYYSPITKIMTGLVLLVLAIKTILVN